jgi:hypothetical protein
MPDGKQRWEVVGHSISEVEAALGKRIVQRREKRFFDMLPGTDITFNALATWYLELRSVKALQTHKRIGDAITNLMKSSVIGSLELSYHRSLRITRSRERIRAGQRLQSIMNYELSRLW